MPTTKEEKAPKPNARKIKMLVRRALREKDRGGKHFDRSREAISLARNAGLQVNQPVEIEIRGEDGSKQKVLFELVDNFAGPIAGRNVVIPHFELKKVPKFKREKAAQAVAESEVAS